MRVYDGERRDAIAARLCCASRVTRRDVGTDKAFRDSFDLFTDRFVYRVRDSRQIVNHVHSGFNAALFRDKTYLCAREGRKREG